MSAACHGRSSSAGDFHRIHRRQASLSTHWWCADIWRLT